MTLSKSTVAISVREEVKRVGSPSYCQSKTSLSGIERNNKNKEQSLLVSLPYSAILSILQHSKVSLRQNLIDSD